MSSWIPGRPSLFPYSMTSQLAKEKYATRKQVFFRRAAIGSAHVAQILRIGEKAWCRSLAKLKEIREVEKPVNTPRTTSHLQRLTLAKPASQDINIFEDLQAQKPSAKARTRDTILKLYTTKIISRCLSCISKLTKWKGYNDALFRWNK